MFPNCAGLAAQVNTSRQGRIYREGEDPIAQGIGFREPLKTSAPLTELMGEIRARVPFRRDDSYFAPDIEAVADIISKGIPRRLLLDTGAEGLLRLEL